MKNITDHKYWIAMALVILIAAVGIGTAVERNHRLESAIRNFSRDVKQADPQDHETSLETIISNFLTNEDVQPVIQISTSDASGPNTQAPAPFDLSAFCAPGRILGELQLYRLKVMANPGTHFTGMTYTYPCQSYSIPWGNAYKNVFGTKGLKYSSTESYNISSSEDCSDIALAAKEIESNVYHYAYPINIPAETQALLDAAGKKVTRGSTTIKSDAEASAELSKSAAMNKAFFQSCVKK